MGIQIKGEEFVITPNKIGSSRYWCIMFIVTIKQSLDIVCEFPKVQQTSNLMVCCDDMSERRISIREKHMVEDPRFAR